MNVDTLTTRRRGLGAAVAVVLGLLLGAPTAAQAALSITASPATPRPLEPVRFSATGSCDGICASWSWKVGTQTILSTGGGAPDPVTYPGFAAPGVYKVTLSYSRLSLLPPWSFDVVKDVTVVANQAPDASFTASPSAPTINQAVTFTDTSTDPEGDALTRAWDLDGDGQYNDGDGRTASRTFATRGAKTVRLRVTDRFGAESVSTRTVTVANVAPTVAMNVTPTTVQTGEPVTFSAVGSDPDGGTVTYAWDLTGNGQYTDATSATPGTRTFTRAGTFTVGVRVTDDDGDASTSTVQRTQVITVTNRPPTTPAITAQPATAARGETVQLTAAATDPEGTPLTYAWDFNDDGDYSDASGATVSRTMPQSGVLAARVRATDADGGSTPSARFSLTAGNRPPSASFTVSPADVTIGQQVTFTDTSTDPDGQDLVRSWDLTGSGSFVDAVGPTAGRTFDTWGQKTIRLRVSDGIDTATATQTVTVRNAPPTVSLTVTPTTVATGAAVSFSVTASDPDGGAVTYAWDLDGDGQYNDSTVAAPPSRAYPRSGTRTIGVRVTDDDGDPGSSTVQRTQVVTVTNRPPGTPSITADPGPVARGESVRLVAAATDPEGTPLAYAWDLDGDDAFTDATGPTVTRTMPQSGTLAARVRVTDADGASATSAPFTLTAPALPDPQPPAPDPDPVPAPEPPPPPVTPAGDPGAPFVSDPPPAVPAASPAPAPAAGSGTKQSTTRPASPRLLRPFPRVRIQGRLTRRGARFTRITVTAPRGTLVTAQCRGRGCPRSARRTVGRAGVVRLSGLLRSYRSGTRIIIRATRSGAIGKHTTIVVRRGRAPKRVDRCLRPGATVPTRCPAN